MARRPVPGEAGQPLLAAAQAVEALLSVADTAGPLTARDAAWVRAAADLVALQAKMLDRMSEGVVLARASDGIIVYTNRGADRMFGYEPGELAGEHVSVLVSAPGSSDREVADTVIAQLREGGCWAGELLQYRKDGSTFWSGASIAGFIGNDGEPMWLSVREDVTARKVAERAKRESDDRLKAIVDNTTAVIYVKDREGRYLLVNRRFEELFEVADADIRGKTDYWLGTSEVADAVRANDLEVMVRGEAVEFDEMVPRGDEPRHYLSIKFPLRDAAGEVYAVCGISSDITDRRHAQRALEEARDELERRVEERTEALTEANRRLRAEIEVRKRAEARQALMMSELDHRVKNSLATVLALADQTAASSQAVEEFDRSFRGRVQAMARTHEALAKGRWEGAELSDVARLVLGAFAASRPERLVVTGAPVRLAARAALPVSLSLNELATNALKHGAWSRATGRVEVGWSEVPDGSVEIRWEEHDGPPVSPPAAGGSGLGLVEDLVSGDLGGRFVIEFLADGVRGLIALPGASLSPSPHPGVAADPTSSPAEPLDLEGLRVLVVEDDRLQARALARMLVGLGCQVVGPSGRLAEALALAESAEIDCALLDVNLGDATSIAVAEALARRGRPFLFVTGYVAAPQLPPHLMDVPRLLKPVDAEMLGLHLRQHSARS